MEIFIGNESSQALSLCGLELFGFNTGCYEERIVGDTKRCSGGVPWRLLSDLDLVSSEKRLVPLCKLIHTSARVEGLADIQLREHVLEPMMHPAVSVQNEFVDQMEVFYHLKFKLQTLELAML